MKDNIAKFTPVLLVIACLTMSHLSKEKRKAYAKLFFELDTDGNGWLSREEIGVWLKEAGYKLTDNEKERVFRTIDKNVDGKVTLDEFYVAVSVIDKPKINISDLKTVFQEIDKNGDGCLSEEELLEGLNQCGYSLSRQQVQKFVANVDKNGDGLISFEEFLAIFDKEDMI